MVEHWFKAVLGSYVDDAKEGCQHYNHYNKVEAWAPTFGFKGFEVRGLGIEGLRDSGI